MSASANPPQLWSLAEGESASVVGFEGDMPEPYRVRLMEFGFHPGEIVSCLLSPGLGAPRVYRVSNTVYSLDSDIARRVLVQPQATESRGSQER